MMENRNGSRAPQRLKSLELNGYKTFANKTKFEFDGNITVVVGPNGSGKSNVADSLRWVLGEQSFGLLRGRKTEDMIFAGSEKKPRASRASATVTFDNSEGWLPIDFAEVSITRRAYRDGQNEYLINNQKVRLRDVTELLSKSGLSERTYTIIGQGLVDTALSLKSEERRRLFEEAAGIGLYRKRKEQTVRRLETTERNIDRVKDILAELEPRLKSLEKQARRTEEHEQIRADLDGVLREWYGYHWHRTQNELLEARKTQQEQDKILDEARQKEETVSRELLELREKINTKRAQLSSWHRQLSQLHFQREETSRDLAVQGERKRSFAEQINNLSIEIDQLEETEKLQEQDVKASEEELDKLREEMKEAKKALEKAEKDLEEELRKHSKLENELNAKQIDLADVEKLKISLGVQIDQAQTLVEQNKKNKEKLQLSIDETEGALEDIRVELNISRKDVAQIESEIKDIISSLDNAINQTNQLEEDKKELTLDLLEMEKSRSQAQVELNVLTQAENKLTGYVDGAKILLEARNKGNDLNILGTVNEKLQVPKDFEIAISALLGEFLDAIILDDEDVSKALIVLAKQSAKSALLPIKAMKPYESIEMADEEDFLGIASELVESSPELMPAVDVLLGRAVVVRNMSAAKRLLAKLPDPCRAVTLEGDVFYSDGRIISDPGSGVEILSRARRKQELEKELGSLEKKIITIDKKKFGLEENQAAIQAKITQFQENLANAKDEENSLQKNFQEKSLGVEQVQNTLTWYEKQSEDLEKEIQRGLDYIENQIKEQANSLSREKELQIIIEKLENDLAKFFAEDLKKDVSHWEKQLAVSMQAVEGTKRNVLDRQRVLDKTQLQKKHMVERRNEIEKISREIADRVEEMHGAEGDAGKKINEIQLLLNPTEEEISDTERKLQEVDIEEEQVRRILSQAERTNVQTQVRLARKQEAFETLRQKIEDDFGLVAFDYEQEVSGPTPLPMGTLIERLPVITELSGDIEDTLKRHKSQLRRMGAINPDAKREYEEVKERYEFLIEQLDDLEKAEKDIAEVLAELDMLMEREFRKTFEQVAGEFRLIFKRLFLGGSARLVLTDEDNLQESGVDIEARLPGKRMQRLALLSGGERAMTAVALVFALIKTSPTPFCVLDEVDAALDEANTDRLRELLQEFGAQTQFVVITHNRDTVQAANLIYGITMGRDTTSQMISLKLEDVDEKYSN